jgi:putative nucleotidyltransferase with HDIG domain
MGVVMKNRTEEILSQVDKLPSMPGTAAKMLSLLNDPDATAKQIEDNLRFDPGLTANILRSANSSYFGFVAKVGSIRQAVVLLGSRRLVQIVMASCLNAILEKPVPGYDLSPGELWRHSIAVSVASEGLMKILGLPGSDKVFTAALLHDVGKLVLGEYINGAIDEIDSIASRDHSFEDAVRQVIGTDHAEIGAGILTQWSFPSELINTVRWHHDPESADEKDPILDIVHISNVVCMMLGIGVGREELQLSPSPMAVKRLGLKTRHIESLASQTLQWVNELNEIFRSNAKI